MTDSEIQSVRIDAGKRQLSKIYALALVTTAEKSGEADEIVDQLDAIVHEGLALHPDLERLLNSPRTTIKEKLTLLDHIFGPLVKPKLLNFVKVVAQHNRLDCLREIAHAARERIHDLRGRVRIQVRTAEPLDEDLRQQILHVVGGALQKEIVLEESVDPQLLGGLVVRVGDKVIDGSVQHQLESMRQESLRRTRQEFQNQNDRFATV